MSLQRCPKRGQANKQVMAFIMDKTLGQIFVDKSVYIVFMEPHHHTVYMPCCNNGA